MSLTISPFENDLAILCVYDETCNEYEYQFSGNVIYWYEVPVGKAINDTHSQTEEIARHSYY